MITLSRQFPDPVSGILQHYTRKYIPSAWGTRPPKVIKTPGVKKLKNEMSKIDTKMFKFTPKMQFWYYLKKLPKISANDQNDLQNVYLQMQILTKKFF